MAGQPEFPALPVGHRASFPHNGVRAEGTIFAHPGTRGRFLMALYDTEGGVEYIYVWPHDLTGVSPSSQDEQPAVFTTELLDALPTDSIVTELLYPAGSWVGALTGGVWHPAHVVAHGQAMKRGRLSEGHADRVTVQIDETLQVLSLHRDQVRPARLVDRELGKPRFASTADVPPVQAQQDLGPLFGGLQ